MALNASKKLIKSVAAFIVSLALCVSACFAWFSFNQEVSADPNKTVIREGEIISFDVSAYYLDGDDGGYTVSSNGNVTDSAGKEIAVDTVEPYGMLGTGDMMRPYGGIGNTFATAVLFKVDYQLKVGTKNYKIVASCPTSSTLDVVYSDDSLEEFTSPLSNAVGFYTAASSDGLSYTKQTDIESFVSAENAKNFEIDLVKQITPSTAATSRGTAYIIMDYDPQLFIYLSSLIIEEGGTLTSSLIFGGDISFAIKEYGSSQEAVPVSVERTGGTATQSIGEDVISSTWTFTVVYSDGSRQVVSASDPRISIGATDTSTAGEKTVEVVFTDGDAFAETTVAYTVTASGTSTVPVTGVALDTASAALTVGDTLNLTATVSPADATDSSVSWSSTDTGVATVENGVVTAVAAGTADITVTTADGGYTATCAVTVTSSSAEDNANLLSAFSGSASSNGTIVDHSTVKVTSSKSGTMTACDDYVSADGLTFSQAFLPSGATGSYTVTATEAVTLTVYYTLTDGSFAAKSGYVTATVGTETTTYEDGTKEKGTAYKLTVTLKAGDTCVLTVSANRFALFGIYVD